MIWQDFVNGSFEFCAGLLLWWNVRIILKDKKIRGVSILPSAVFGLWGFWNLYYYPFLKQILSFLGGIFVVFANTTWVVLAIYYTLKEKKKVKIKHRNKEK